MRYGGGARARGAVRAEGGGVGPCWRGKCGYRLMTQEEWDEENRAKEKAPCAAATAQGEDR